ncbi:hypothetical protein JUJ52_02745 [Virgibacillus sp. AGTR]|uniref:hypothetical protein n=1 Tax=Virgibacillus sp. AGTR TaxID=2812055 RepID=UPI001D16BD64|nr:hypothetical protein [Virgibacillus sp. AGTR]MCC2248876.1 hypothetical protein [Virgibacillus sp. AGTR]
MTKKKAEIIFRISVVDKEGGEDLKISVDLKGTNNEVMEIAEIAQNLDIIGEAGVENILVNILNEEKPLLSNNPNGPIH